MTSLFKVPRVDTGFECYQMVCCYIVVKITTKMIKVTHIV